MKTKDLVLCASLMWISALTVSAQYLATDKQFYVKNSDSSGTAWVEDYPTPPPYDDGSGNTFTFYDWYYYWGDEGSGNTDQTYADLDVSQSSSSEGDKEVTCSLVPSYTNDCTGEEVCGDPINITSAHFTVCEIKSTTEQTVPSNRDRKEVAVGERVTLEILPAVQVNWVTDGSGTLSSSYASLTTYIASNEGNDAETISATFGDGSVGNISFSVLEPYVVLFESPNPTTNAYTTSANDNSGQRITYLTIYVNSLTTVWYGPSNVNLTGITTKEGTCPGQTTSMTGQTMGDHDPGNLTQSFSFLETRGWKGNVPDTLSANYSGNINDFSPGFTDYWDIPYTYTVNGKTYSMNTIRQESIVNGFLLGNRVSLTLKKKGDFIGMAVYTNVSTPVIPISSACLF